MNTLEKALPHNIDAEESVLGAILLDRDAILKVAAFLRPGDFFREKNSWVFEAILDLYERREPTDILTLGDELQRRNRLEPIGGPGYLSTLINAVPTAVHVEYYARIVERTSTMRRLVRVAGEIARIGYESADDVEGALNRAEELLYSVAERRVTRDFVSFRELLGRFWDHMDHVHEHRGESLGVPTGFYELDELTGGLQRSDLIILAARPSAGKTSLALNIVHHVALKPRMPVAMFSLEMSADQLVHRMLALETGIDVHRLRLGEMNDSDWHHLSDAIGRLSDAPVYVDDTPSIPIVELRSKARRLNAEQGLGLIVVDYLQLIQGRRTDNRVQEVSEISRSLKALAREVNVPVIALSQLSRAVESRQSHEPQLSDLRESGCLAGDTPVYLPQQGAYRPIRELVGQRGFSVLALDRETWRLEPRLVANAFRTGYRPVFHLVTRLGRRVRATANHKFLTVSGWQRLDQLAPGMRLALPRSLPGPAAVTVDRARLALAVQADESDRMARRDIYWDEIATIEPDGEEDVYDLTVEGLHNFVAGDVLVHNSIEQDADVVMFIYRDELYNDKSDRKGIADIIVAKHRNGPIGRFGLRFFNQQTRFANLDVYHREEDAQG